MKNCKEFLESKLDNIEGIESSMEDFNSIKKGSYLSLKLDDADYVYYILSKAQKAVYAALIMSSKINKNDDVEISWLSNDFIESCIKEKKASFVL